jgi:hypothetical protein
MFLYKTIQICMVFLLAFTLSIMLYFPYMNSKKPFITLAVLLITLLTSSITYATLAPLTPPPPGGYDSGSNSILDPGCLPNAVDCVVNLPSGGSITADNGLSVTGSNVQLGGALIQDTTITQGIHEFVLQGTNAKLVSGADPLDLFPLIGEAFPGVGISTDGILTGGMKSYIGALISPSNNKSLTIVGNFDIANGIQVGMVAEDKEINISSSDSVSGSSNISLSPGVVSLFANDGIDIYTNNYINFNNFGSSRDDSGTNFPTNFLYTDGSGNLQSAPTSLLGGGGSSLSSQDEGTLLTSTTTGYNFIGAGVTATESGGLVTVNIPGGGGGADGSIYLNDGTLTGNRTLNGGGNDLTFNNLNNFTLQTNLSGLGTTAGIGIAHSDNGSNVSVTGSYLNGSGDFISSSFYTGGQSYGYSSGIRTINAVTNKTANIIANPDDGISFVFTNPASGGYRFPRTDGVGTNAGSYWSNASGPSGASPFAANSIFIGTNSGYTLTQVNTTTNADDFAILLGNYTSTGGFENSIALGQMQPTPPQTNS